ncbi:2'-5'-oligoadenylate synthase 1A-like [Branchiostoma floridae]|uniref:2'-5'-oligoadenylate synthase 1A-like n=1 Tax=Branchiostoma floridae TaxID=7739 RepID=A0A9J7LLZ3_BRAFL|nr:2'-5'-oligoadenylate synthase 1A-like [Branchiostoma floridae]
MASYTCCFCDFKNTVLERMICVVIAMLVAKGRKVSTSFSLGPTATTVPADFNDFLNDCRLKDVHSYISQHLQTDESFRDECSSAVDHLADFFKRRPLFTVCRFIKGGSLGKGTAIKSKSDIDCVMFIDELPQIDDSGYSRALKRYLDQMEETLRMSRRSIAYDFVVEDRTKHAVKLSMQTQKKDHESHDVDLLLAKDILGPQPTGYKKAEVYAMMGRMTPSGRENCSAALVELQRDFVKHQSTTDVKNLILLVKMWKKSSVAVTTLKSYQLELLCIHVWNSLPIYCRHVATAFGAVLRKLCDYNSICACWTDNYSIDRVPRDIAIARPLILDPANPYNNVADVCKNWPEVAAAAKRTLQKQFFK